MAPLLVFGAVIVIAGLYVAYVLWPRWPDAPVALDAPSVPIVISGTVFNIEPAAIRRDLDIFRLAQCRRFGAARPISVMVFNTTMQRSVRVHAAGIAAPADLTARANSGFGDFDEMCVECHSAPGMEHGEVGKGLNPRPPRLVNAARRWSPSELFWILKNGIRITECRHSHDDTLGNCGFRSATFEPLAATIQVDAADE